MNQQGITPQKPKSKVPKYSDKFKDLLNKIQTSNKQKIQKENITQTQTIVLNTHHNYQFVFKQQKQYFFYRIKSIGVGAHSFVYLVQDQETKCLYAQKAIVKNHAQEHLNQLKNQIKIQYQLNHDNLISLYYFYSDNSYVYLIMQYAQQSLFNLKTKFVIFKEKEIIQILRQLLHGLLYMHKHGYVHADIKIENIMIRNGRIKICDFGYASKFYEQKVIDPSQIIGTLEYLSPQYVQGLDSGPYRDVWAVGILCYQLWTGKNPFQQLKQNQKWLKLVRYLSQYVDQTQLQLISLIDKTNRIEIIQKIIKNIEIYKIYTMPIIIEIQCIKIVRVLIFQKCQLKFEIVFFCGFLIKVV